MATYFAFSDESGKYKKERSDKFILKNPFYCRSVVLIRTDEWMRLREEFTSLARELLHLEPPIGLKWSYIWSLYKHRQKREKIPPSKPYSSLKQYSLDKLIEFVRKILQKMRDTESSRIILTLTFNERKITGSWEEKEILKKHLSHALKMIEKQMEEGKDDLCAIFFNQEEPALEKKLKLAFQELFKEKGAEKYPRIKDSLCFELSPYGTGSILADYCAGVFNGCLRLYPQSIDLFQNQVWPKIIKEKSEALGAGITEIPKNKKNRGLLTKLLSRVFTVEEKNFKVSAEERLRVKKSVPH